MSTTLNEPFGEGFLRNDGRIGLRNHVIAFSTVGLSDRITALAASLVPGVLTVTPTFQRGLRGADAELQHKMVQAIVDHPNVGAALVVTHDRAAAAILQKAFAQIGKPVEVVAVMEQAGIQKAVDVLSAQLRLLVGAMEKAPSVPMRLSDLTLALECGGSDATSSICANPVIGRFVDRVIAAGGTAIVSETAEFLGGEDVIRAQSRTPDIASDILAFLAEEEAMMQAGGADYRGVNPTQENIEAGLSTLTEKTMGAVCKIGASQFSGALTFGQTPPSKGLYFMHTPFFSPTSITGMVLGGAQVTLFAMGVFNPSGMPLAPTLKICGNPQTLTQWEDGIDLDVSAVISGQMGYDSASDAVLTHVAAISSGTLTATERWQDGQIILPQSLAPL